MSQLEVHAEGTARATPETVWALVSDAERYPEWGPWDRAGYDRPGDHSPHGPGAVRRLGMGRTTTLERILEVDEYRRVVYTVVEGIPVRHYRAEVVLTETAGGTHIDWTASWDRTLVGRLVHRRLRTLYPEVVADLVKAAEQHSFTV